MQKSTLTLLAALAALEVLLHWSLLGGVTARYQRDLFLLYFPLVESTHRAMSEGAWPLRDPSSAFGQPLLGDPSCQILYPPTWLHLLLPAPLAYSWIVSLHSVFGALGVAQLTRRLSAGHWGAGFAGGAAWLVCGPLHSLGDVWHHMAGAAWIPWALVCLEWLIESPRPRQILALGLVMGSQILAGSAEMCAMTILLLAVRIVVGGHLGLWRVWTAIAVIALALGAGAWIPAADVVAHSGRTVLPESLRTYWSLHPLSILELVLPVPFSALPLRPEWRLALFDARAPFLRSVFLGTACLPLALAWLFDERRSRALRITAFMGTAGGILIALGKHAVAYHWFVSLFPPFQIFRYPSKAVVPVAVLVCVMAGAGVASVEGSKRARWAALGAVGVIGLIALLLAFPALEPFERLLLDTRSASEMEGISKLLRFDLLLSVALLALLGIFVARPRGRVGFIAAAVLLLGQVGQTVRLNEDPDWTVSTSVLAYKPSNVESVRPSHGGRVFAYDYDRFEGRARKLLGRNRLLQVQGLEPLSPGAATLIATRSAFQPLVGAAWGLDYAWDADLRRLFDRRMAGLILDLYRAEGTPAFLKLLQVSGVEHVVAVHERGLEDLVELKRFRAFIPEDIKVLGVPDPLPRLSMVGGRKRGTGNDFLDLTSPDFNPHTTVLVDEGPARPASQTLVSSVRVVRRTADRLLVETSSNEPAFLSAIEGALPGWRAFVDEKSVKLERANALFIGTEVPAGAHLVEFRFLPASAVLGVSITAATAFLLLLGFVRTERKVV